MRSAIASAVALCLVVLCACPAGSAVRVGDADAQCVRGGSGNSCLLTDASCSAPRCWIEGQNCTRCERSNLPTGCDLCEPASAYQCTPGIGGSPPGAGHDVVGEKCKRYESGLMYCEGGTIDYDHECRVGTGAVGVACP